MIFPEIIRSALSVSDGSRLIQEKPFAQNISMDAAKRGLWINSPSAVYIQITDPGYAFESAENSFVSIHRFEFLDVEGPSFVDCIKPNQVNELVSILNQTADLGYDLVVSCHAGLCRSGAVVEAMIRTFNYTDTQNIRKPNQFVLQSLLKGLGSAYDPETSAFHNME